jgi:protein gp37
MGEDSKIEWTDHTFNPWVGCQKVSEACTNCYAETWARRAGTPELWHGQRRRTSAANWKEPIKWNKAARETGGRTTYVFAASLADVFEDAAEWCPPMVQWRVDFFRLVELTPNLTWLLLTKRTEHIRNMVPRAWLHYWPRHVITGCTVENQKRADERLPHLVNIPGRHFVSMEPLLGPVDLTYALFNGGDSLSHIEHRLPGIDWVITGGESGGKARPSHPAWYRDIRDQCAKADVPFHHKQNGEWLGQSQAHVLDDDAQVRILSGEMMARNVCAYDDGEKSGPIETLYRVGKHAAGRLLDGVEHNGVPR